MRRLEKVGIESLESDGKKILDTIPCQCDDCKYLKLFLRSNETQLLWPLAKTRRQHIHEVIDGMCIRVKHVTRREGSPHKLMLSKTNQYFKEKEVLRLASLKALKKMKSSTE